MKISKVFDQNRFKEVKISNECHWLGEEINSAKLSLILELEVELREHLGAMELPAMACNNNFWFRTFCQSEIQNLP